MRPACYYFNYNTEAVGVCVAHYFKGSLCYRSSCAF